MEADLDADLDPEADVDPDAAATAVPLGAGSTSAFVPISMTGCAEGLSQRSRSRSCPSGRATHPSVAPPTQPCRKIPEPSAFAPARTGFMLN